MYIYMHKQECGAILKYHDNFFMDDMEIECINIKLLARNSMVIKVNSPTMFWVQLKTGSEDFQDLFEELNRRMIRKRHVLSSHL